MSNGTSVLERTARALIGWMPPAEALLTLTGTRQEQPADPELVQRVERARQQVQGRPAGLDQTGLHTPPPASLDRHVAALKQRPASAPVFDQGWRVAVVDLRKVVAMQKVVFVESADARTADLDPSDLEAVAAVSIPLPGDSPLPSQFDQLRQAFTFSSANTNLRIAGPFSTAIGPGLAAFGFVVGIQTSYMMVAALRGRFVLCDGYHRAYSFLGRGIHTVPVLVRDYGDDEDLVMPARMLPAEACFGDRPPLLTDYLDDVVAASVRLARTQKIVVIQAMDLTPVIYGDD